MNADSLVRCRRVLSELVMRRTKNQNLTGFIVEGSSDRRLLQRFIVKTACDILPAGGRTEVFEVMQRAAAGRVIGVVGLIDQDEFLFQGKIHQSDHIFVTDFTDLDTMLFSSPALLAAIVELAIRNDDNRSSVAIDSLVATTRERVYAAAHPLGLCRRLSSVNGWGIDFEALVYRYFVDPVTCICDVGRLLAHIDTLKRSGSASIDTIGAAFHEAINATHGYCSVVRGHDLTAILSLCAASLIGRACEQEQFERLLRLGYGMDHLRNTVMFKSIAEWSGRNKPYLVWAL
jgi:hypothetical protein